MAKVRRTVLITGCTTGGIGHALALEFHKQGCHVLASARDTRRMQDLVDHPDIDTIQLDVCDFASISAAKQRVEELTGGKLDYLVNNAGGGAVAKPAIELSIDDARRTLDLNFLSVVHMVAAFSPLLITSGAGHIVNIGSVVATMPIPYLTIYNASKAALHAYGDTLRVELAPFNIAVTTIVTGFIENSKDVGEFDLSLAPGSLYLPTKEAFTKFMSESSKERTSSAEYASATVAHVLKSRSRRVYIGKGTWISRMATNYIPHWILEFMMVKSWGLDKALVGAKEEGMRT